VELPLDTKWVFPANILTSTEAIISNTAKATIHQKHDDTMTSSL